MSQCVWADKVLEKHSGLRGWIPVTGGSGALKPQERRVLLIVARGGWMGAIPFPRAWL